MLFGHLLRINGKRCQYRVKILQILLIERIIVGDIQFVRSSLCERDAVADKRKIIERILDIPLQQIFHILCRLVLIGIVDDCLQRCRRLGKIIRLVNKHARIVGQRIPEHALFVGCRLDCLFQHAVFRRIRLIHGNKTIEVCFLQIVPR